MNDHFSSHSPAPIALTEPLIVDRLSPEALSKVRVYVEEHGGIWDVLADGGYQISFPPGTQQWSESRSERSTTDTIQFPDGALLTLYICGRISPASGWPQIMRKSISIPRWDTLEKP